MIEIKKYILTPDEQKLGSLIKVFLILRANSHVLSHRLLMRYLNVILFT